MSARGTDILSVAGGVCAVEGVRAAGICAGLKASGKPDMALVAVDRPVPAAGVQTSNQILAAPVVVTARHLSDGRARAVLCNAGNANVCTGPDGLALAEESARAVAAELGCAAADVLLCSTGVIGVPFAAEPLLAGIPRVAARLGSGGHAAAARAIMTTDTVVKESAVEVTGGAGSCVVGGMAKGSGMIAPAMATMLCVLTTDAPLDGVELRRALATAVARSFDRISVDGCMSTNDAVLLLATGTAVQPPGAEAFTAGLTAVCADLAEQIVRDGEGATRLLRIDVTGARSEDDAVAVGRAVASSALVKTALAGGDPNWGRVLAAIGAGPVRIDPDRIAVAFGGVTVCRSGVAAAFDEAEVTAVLRGRDVTCSVDLGLGDAHATFLTCDLTQEYVRINAEYTT